MLSGNEIKVVILDPSAVDGTLLMSSLQLTKSIKVTGLATDPFEARDLIVLTRPDLLILSLELPRISGLKFLAKLHEYWPIPTIAISRNLIQEPTLHYHARALGAVAVLARPPAGLGPLIQQIKDIIFSYGQDDQQHGYAVIAIGASTGGTEAIKVLLQNLPSNLPGILIVQHMPAEFTGAFAERLDGLCQGLRVREAKAGDLIRPGRVLVAPGDYHMLLHREGRSYYVDLNTKPPVAHHRPSVNVLFHAVAKEAGAHAIGVILTGMGNDGAEGMLAMKRAGSITLAQDRETCVVHGMPKEAMALNAVVRELPLHLLPSEIVRLANTKPPKRRKP